MSKEPHKSAHPLNPQQEDFLRRYLKTGKARESAILAGYAPKSASKIAGDMLRNNLTIKQSVERHRENASTPPSGYDLAAAMKEADEAIQLAKDTENAASFLAAVKLKAQLMKILDDRPQGAAFQIMISGIGGEDGQKTVINVASQEIKKLPGEDGGNEGNTN